MAEEKIDLLKGTLDLLVLQILSSMGPIHGYGIARRLEQISGDELAMNEGTIYASLLGLQHRRLIKTAWGTSVNNRRAKYYSLTRAARRFYSWAPRPELTDGRNPALPCLCCESSTYLELP